MSYLTAIGVANPAHRFPQSVIAEFMVRAMQLNRNGDARKLRTIFRSTGIDYRHSVLGDYGRVRGFTFYPDTADLEPFPSTEKRLQMFRQHALALGATAVRNMMKDYNEVNLQEVTHLIVVCCTGMYAPGLDVDLVKTLGLRRQVDRTAINFMGCQASFNALKVADAICSRNSRARVLVVCTELCSLHFQRAPTDDNLVANALFADGAAAVMVQGMASPSLALRLDGFHSELAFEGIDDMAWTIGDAGFEMRLSSYVPDLLRAGIGDLVTSLLRKVSMEMSDIRYFAVHPGGKRILKAIEAELGISRAQNDCAYEVLRNYGNMSSPTVLFVLQRLVQSLGGTSQGEKILALAFGPGLTMESMVLNIENLRRHA